MKPEIKNALDKEASKEKRVWVYGFIFATAIILIISSIFITVTAKTIMGTTISYTAVQTDDGAMPKVRVKLESGNIVIASFPRGLAFKYGKKAEILEGRTLVGKPSYRFVRYAN